MKKDDLALAISVWIYLSVAAIFVLMTMHQVFSGNDTRQVPEPIVIEAAAVSTLPPVPIVVATEATSESETTSSEIVSEPPEIAEIVEEEVEEIVVSDIAKELLACVIYQEAGADYCCDNCRRRVADVVLNRLMSPYFPNSLLGVLTQKYQYGRYYWTGVVWPSHASQESEKEAVGRAYRIAEEVLSGQHSELFGNGWIWQAEFPQGRETIKCCGIYFGR